MSAIDDLRRDGALVVDIRPFADPLAEGEIPGSVPVERIHLEWRLAPGGAHRLCGFTADTAVVVVCNEGYSSSPAARGLQRLGLRHATDLVGGFRAWASAGPHRRLPGRAVMEPSALPARLA